MPHCETENRLNLYFPCAFLAVTSNNLLKLIGMASLFGAVTLIYITSGKSSRVFTLHALRRQDLTI